MALLHHRILYPRPNATDCIAVCDVACQFYELCSYSPPPYSSLPSNSTPIQLHHASTPFPIPLVAAAASFIAAASLLLLLALCALHRFRRHRRRHGSPADAAQDDGGGDLFEVRDADGHQAWHIRTVGLDEPTIRSIAAWAYKPGDGLLGAADNGCPVCLADFRDGELLRLLPKCGHAFHVPCIDTWLRSHLNCPLCRAPVVVPATAALPSPSASFLAATTDPVDPNSGSPPLAEDTEIAFRPPETGRVEPEGETESGVAEIGAGIGIAMVPLAASSSSPPRSQFWVPSGPGEDGLRSVRQSVSMDSSSLAAHLSKADPEAGSSEERKDSDLEEESTTKKGGKQGSASKGGPQQKDPREMERSPSSSSRRLFSSGHGRGRSAVLPL